jgi:hypothetical protein
MRSAKLANWARGSAGLFPAPAFPDLGRIQVICSNAWNLFSQKLEKMGVKSSNIWPFDPAHDRRAHDRCLENVARRGATPAEFRLTIFG